MGTLTCTCRLDPSSHPEALSGESVASKNSAFTKFGHHKQIRPSVKVDDDFSVGMRASLFRLVTKVCRHARPPQSEKPPRTAKVAVDHILGGRTELLRKTAAPTLLLIIQPARQP